MTIKKIADILQKAMEVVRLPAKTIPAIMLICSIIKRPGLSAMMTAANAIQAQRDFGAPTGNFEDGTPNMMNAMIYKLTENIYNDITRNGVVQIAIPAGGIQVTVTGGNAGGPITCTGVNTNNVTGYGLLH